MINKIFKGAKKGSAVAIAYFPFGFTLGLIASKVGLSAFETTFMTVVIYAGSSQIIILKLLEANSPIIQIIMAAVVVNIRYLFINISLLKEQSLYNKKSKFLSCLFMTDEAVSYLYLTKTFNVYETIGFGLCGYLAFCVSAFLGAVFGNFIPIKYTISLNFVLYAVFVYLLVQVLKCNIRYIYIVIITIIIKYILSYLGFSASLVMLLSIIFGALLSVILKEKVLNGKL